MKVFPLNLLRHNTMKPTEISRLRSIVEIPGLSGDDNAELVFLLLFKVRLQELLLYITRNRLVVSKVHCEGCAA